jgi:hypothetical protein
MGKVWRRETLAYEDDSGLYWEDPGDWEQIEGDLPDWWYSRLDPALGTITKVVLWAATAYIAAIALTTLWGCR